MVGDEVQIYAFFKVQDSSRQHFELKIELKLADIFVIELKKFLKSDSEDVTTFFRYLESLKIYRRFGFHKFGKIDEPRYGSNIVTLSDLFYQSKFRRVDLKLVIYSPNITKTIKMTDCQVLTQYGLDTPIGTLEIYNIHYQKIVFEQ